MLKELSLVPVYDSTEHDLIHDLIVPLLKNSNLYLRGVGFFTSGWLKLTAIGLAELIEHGGTAKIVLSPHMEKHDWEAFQLGEEAKNNIWLKEVLKRNIENISLSLEKDTLNTLAWMIADNILEFRFAVAREHYAGGDYHDKVAVFIDKNNDSVAIHGSFNDSIKGSLNGEAFSVFKSWEEGQRAFVEEHNKRLRLLWENKNRQFQVFTIPNAIKEAFIKLRSSTLRPYAFPQNPEIRSVINVESPASVKLYPYQEDAIANWLKAGQKGIFEMATGTGKTITALSCAVNRYNDIGRLALIILVPYLHLLEQWEFQCKLFGFHSILCSGNHKGWFIRAKSKIQDYNLGVIDNICIIAVHATASSERFAGVVEKLKPESALIIADEVHNLGAPNLRRALTENFEMRLGLSATPRRWLDDDGTKALFSYFGQVCFEFPIEKAIGKYLTPYEYLPEVVNLTSVELDSYVELSNRISILLNAKERNVDIQEDLKKLLIERARIIATAENKLPKLLTIINDLIKDCPNGVKGLTHVLVYCAPGTHREVLIALSNIGLRCREFVHYVSLAERQRVLKEFTSGNIQVIVAVKCLDEGVDIPSSKTAFMLASTSNPREFIQRRGRILRLSKNKNKATIYDFIVTPKLEDISSKKDIGATLLKREMPRFAEFAASATNEFVARSKLWELLNQYELLNLFDEKPWDMYYRIQNDPTMIDNPG